MKKIDVLKAIMRERLIAVVRADSCDETVRISNACIAGGIKLIEITFTTPLAHRAIETLSAKHSCNGVFIGAGTVLDSETARIAILSGADFVVCPNINLNSIELCNRYGTVCIPGAVTVSEITSAMEKGADIIKLFPADTYTPSIIKALKAPLPNANIMPTGGITAENASEWLKAGAVAVGAGGKLTCGTDKEIEEKARIFIQSVYNIK